MEEFFENRFLDKVMIVTGGASGIGRAVASRAVREGAKVVIADMNEEKGRETEVELSEQGGQIIFQKADLTKEQEAADIINRAVDEYGKVDILINNAGITSVPQQFHQADTSALKHIIQCNFYSVFYCSKHFLDQVIKQKTEGSIVNTASIAGLNGIPCMLPYVASKHAVNGLTKNMAIDYAKYRVRVNSVNPYATKTPLGDAGLKILEESQKKAKEAGDDRSKRVVPGLKTVNLQKRGSYAEEQASSILYLASDEASHITGAIFQTDGGYSTY